MTDVDPVGGICVVTFRSRETSQNATRELLEILSCLTTVSLVTAGLRADSVIRDRYEVVDVASGGTGFGPSSMAVRFVLNQVRVCRYIADRDEQVVLFFGATAYVIPVLFARLLGKTVVVEPRGDVPLTLELRWREVFPTPVANSLARVVRGFERVTFRVASAIITYTPAMAEELDLAPYAGKLHTQGARHVDVERFRPVVAYESRDPLVGFVGRLDHEKGIPLLAEVASLLAPGIGFVFVGDGHLREELGERLRAEIDAGDVELVGWVDHEDVPGQMNRLKLLVMPSAPTEGLPSTILEGFACGTPAYVTPVSGVPDVVKEGETGFLMREASAGDVAGRVRTILERDDLVEVSAEARSLIEREYSFEATVERYREMFADIA